MTANKSFRVAAIQMVSGLSLEKNLTRAQALIAEAAKQGAELVALPEYFCLMGKHDRDKVDIREEQGSGPIQDFLSRTARELNIWLHGGSLPLQSEDTGRIYNSTLVYAPDGSEVARYDKIHLFGFQKGEESYDESLSIKPGEVTAKTFNTPVGKVGLSICYDLRFPELYRAMKAPALIIVPSAFTYTTGSAHWELLLRARAVENQCYVLAPAQGGKHENGRRTWGHSMLVDPWGEVVSCLPEGDGCVVGDIEPGRLEEIRISLPALKHRTM